MSYSLDPMDYSPSGFSVHGISQEILERVVISFSMGSSQHRDQALSPALAGGFFTTDLPGKPGRSNILLPKSNLKVSQFIS